MIALGAVALVAACADEPTTPPSGFPQQPPQTNQNNRTSLNQQNGPGDPAPPDGPLRNVVISAPPAIF